MQWCYAYDRPSLEVFHSLTNITASHISSNEIGKGLMCKLVTQILYYQIYFVTCSSYMRFWNSNFEEVPTFRIKGTRQNQSAFLLQVWNIQKTVSEIDICNGMPLQHQVMYFLYSQPSVVFYYLMQLEPQPEIVCHTIVGILKGPTTPILRKTCFSGVGIFKKPVSYICDINIV